MNESIQQNSGSKECMSLHLTLLAATLYLNLWISFIKMLNNMRKRHCIGLNKSLLRQCSFFYEKDLYYYFFMWTCEWNSFHKILLLFSIIIILLMQVNENSQTKKVSVCIIFKRSLLSLLSPFFWFRTESDRKRLIIF